MIESVKPKWHDCPLPDIDVTTWRDGVFSQSIKWRCDECGQRWRTDVTRHMHLRMPNHGYHSASTRIGGTSRTWRHLIASRQGS